MKKQIIYIILLAACSLILSGCSDYLDIVPKGKKVPSTLVDYRAFMENSDMHVTQAQYTTYLTNEFMTMATTVNGYPLVNANYLWREDSDRISLSETDGAYDWNYKGIYYANTIINGVAEVAVSTEAEKQEARELTAQAKVLRAMNYFYLVNTYAKPYDAATAAKDGGVAYITSSDDFDYSAPQQTVKEIYGHILDDLNSALPNLPEQSQSFFQPNKTVGYAMLARTHLFMKNFNDAYTNAEEALKRQSYIYDMVAYHTTYVPTPIQSNKAAFSGLPGITYTLGKDENICMRFGTLTHLGQGFVTVTLLPDKDSVGNRFCTRSPARYEVGDTRFLCNFYRNTASKRYEYTRRDDINTGGIRTVEVYLMRAECFARQGNLQKAMDDVNAIRVKRIIASKYQPLVASTVAQAMDYIRNERDVELMGSGMMFFDMRRFNTETAYQRTMVKKDHNGVVRTLAPNSDLWIMPFPLSVTSRNGNVKQNTGI